MLKHGPLCQQRLAAPWDQRLSQPLAPPEVGKSMDFLWFIVWFTDNSGFLDGEIWEYYIDDLVSEVVFHECVG